MGEENLDNVTLYPQIGEPKTIFFPELFFHIQKIAESVTGSEPYVVWLARVLDESRVLLKGCQIVIDMKAETITYYPDSLVNIWCLFATVAFIHHRVRSSLGLSAIVIPMGINEFIGHYCNTSNGLNRLSSVSILAEVLMSIENHLVAVMGTKTNIGW